MPSAAADLMRAGELRRVDDLLRRRRVHRVTPLDAIIREAGSNCRRVCLQQDATRHAATSFLLVEVGRQQVDVEFAAFTQLVIELQATAGALPDVLLIIQPEE